MPDSRDEAARAEELEKVLQPGTVLTDSDPEYATDDEIDDAWIQGDTP